MAPHKKRGIDEITDCLYFNNFFLLKLTQQWLNLYKSFSFSYLFFFQKIYYHENLRKTYFAGGSSKSGTSFLLQYVVRFVEDNNIQEKIWCKIQNTKYIISCWIHFFFWKEDYALFWQMDIPIHQNQEKICRMHCQEKKLWFEKKKLCCASGIDNKSRWIHVLHTIIFFSKYEILQTWAAY